MTTAGQKNKKISRNVKVQVRITPEEKLMIDKLRDIDKEFNVSSFFRKSLIDYYHNKIKGIGSFKIGE
jgi:hypothetical protein